MLAVAPLLTTLPDVSQLFNHDFIVARVTRLEDGQGGYTLEFADLPGMPIRGVLTPATSTERLIAAQQQARVTHTFYCLPTDIARGDQVRVADASPSGLPYPVVYVVDVRNPNLLDHHLEISVEEKQV